jgi:cobalamin biosynthesis Mg chelatase CobN
MVRNSALTSMFKFVIALLTALFIALVGGVTVPAGAHDCGCQVDNSGPGSANSGPGNACHDNSGPGSTTSGSSGSDNSGSSGSDNSGSNSGPSANSGSGNGDECPPAAPGDDPGNDSGDSGNDSNDMGDQATSSNTVVQGAQASVRSSSPTQGASAQVPTAVSAGLTGGPESPSSALPVVMMLVGLTMLVGALVRRRPRD